MSIDLLMNPSEPGDDAHESCRDVAISLRERAEKAERELRLWKEFFEEERDKLVHAYNRIDDLEEEREQQRAILARYEAPGPALLVAEHDLACTRRCLERAIGCCSCCTGSCGFEVRNAAYREQHARDVAVFNMGADEPWSLLDVQLAAEKFIAALTGEAEK